ILEVIDHRTNGVGGRVNRAYSFKLLERRTLARAAVDREIVFPTAGQFPPLLTRVHRSEHRGGTGQKDRHQTAKNSLVHRAMIHDSSPSAIAACRLKSLRAPGVQRNSLNLSALCVLCG